MKEDLFYTKISPITKIINVTILVICTLVTFGIVGNFLYDFFACREYYLNRRILNKFLKQPDIKFEKKYIEYIDVTEYEFDGFKVWVHESKINMTLSTPTHYDVIGLFAASNYEKLYVINLIRKLKSL